MTDERKTAGNKGFAIAGVPCFADTLVQGGSSVLRMKFSAKIPRHRKPPKRWQYFYRRHLNIKKQNMKDQKLQPIDENTSPLFRIMSVYNSSAPKKILCK